MDNYIVRQGECLLDVVLNSTGDESNWEAILDANGFDSWTPDLVVGQEIIIPDTVVINPNVKSQLDIYPSVNTPSIPDFDDLVNDFISDMGGTVTIGTQVWQTKNVSDNIEGSRVYDDDESNRAVYGGLYSWDMIAAIEALHPGWHVPTSDEWIALGTYVSGDPGHVKESGLAHWNTPNCGSGYEPSDNSSGFTGLGSGFWYPTGGGFYAEQKISGYLWLNTETPDDPTKARAGDLHNDYNVMCAGVDILKTIFCAIRLIKNAPVM